MINCMRWFGREAELNQWSRQLAMTIDTLEQAESWSLRDAIINVQKALTRSRDNPRALLAADDSRKVDAARALVPEGLLAEIAEAVKREPETRQCVRWRDNHPIGIPWARAIEVETRFGEPTICEFMERYHADGGDVDCIHIDGFPVTPSQRIITDLLSNADSSDFAGDTIEVW